MTNCLTGLSPLFNILEIKRVLHAVEGAETNRLKRKNPQCISHYGILDPRGERINRTNIF
jgi:hypothetical protein